MSTTINVPAHVAPPICGGIPQLNKRKQQINPPCGQTALGIYEWTTKSFGREIKHKAMLCASCGLALADKVKCFEVDGELVFYKPNTDVTILARFNYQHGVTGAMVCDKQAAPAHLPQPHTLVQTLNGQLEHRHRRPRVYCEKCDCAVNAMVVVEIRTHRNGKQSRHVTSTCAVCGSPTHNPDKD